MGQRCVGQQHVGQQHVGQQHVGQQRVGQQRVEWQRDGDTEWQWGMAACGMATWDGDGGWQRQMATSNGDAQWRRAVATMVAATMMARVGGESWWRVMAV